MKKQTAVEWLEHHLKDFFQIDFAHLEYMTKAFDQAKAMEKEQIIDAFNYARYRLGDSSNYYNETYGGDK